MSFIDIFGLLLNEEEFENQFGAGLRPAEEPKEEQTTSLPKKCYMSNGKSKVDFVIVCPVIDESMRNDQRQTQIDRFMTSLKGAGLVIEKELGKHFTTLTFIKIHGPHSLLVRYAKIFNSHLTCQNPYYKFHERSFFRCLDTEVTKPNPFSSVYSRAEDTLSGRRPTELTSFERSRIVYEIIKQTKFSINNEEYDFKILMNLEVILEAYPIHDGDCLWTDSGPLSDRQLLYQYWANIKYIFKEQPVHLLERYYGPQVAFYFAFHNFYTKMLAFPTIVGLICSTGGLIYLLVENSHINTEVCQSNITLCSDQHLRSACGLMKLAYFVDNPWTIAYVIICCFWGVVFWTTWQRRECILRIRWNLTGIILDRTMRLHFQEKAKIRKSSITGEEEYYIPAYKKVLYFVFSNFLLLCMMIVFVVMVNLVVYYRLLMMQKVNYDETNNANVIELVSSCALTTTIIIALSSLKRPLTNIYSNLMKFLTKIRLPRTQRQFDKIFLHKMFIFQLANYLIPLFYLAFVKGFFHSYPGNVSKIGIIRNIQLDLCKPSGCLVDLGMQLIIIVLFDGIVTMTFEFIRSRIYPYVIGFGMSKEIAEEMGQWEADYILAQFDASVINELYTNLVIQYCFITFFNASLPLIGLVAMIYNLIKLQLNAYTFIKLYRRPVMPKVGDIGGWNEILKAVTFFGTISNTFVIAFRHDFILRLWYRNKHNGTLHGFVNNTLSKFLIDDYPSNLLLDIENATHCYYRGFRYPPEHPRKYEQTEEYWQVFAIRSLYFILLENFTLILSLLLSFVIPVIPRKAKVKLEYEAKLLREAREAKLREEMK